MANNTSQVPARSSREPLLGYIRPPHHHSSADPESASLLPHRTPADFAVEEQKRRRKRKMVYGLFGTAFGVLVGVVVAGAVHVQRSPGPGNQRNVILMISDGFGPASETLARNYKQYTDNLPIGFQLPLDTILVGSSRTQSTDSLVTDSAAGATAFACGIKTYNGGIAVDADAKPCGTVLESAKEKGYFTGMVVTSRITHATPASFAAHVASRASENDIALQEIGHYPLGRRVDLMFGGGACQFRPRSQVASCRKDDLDLFDMARKEGWNVVNDLKPFQEMSSDETTLPILSLFTPDHMSYSIDRDAAKEPSLKEMSVKALDILTAANQKKPESKGFFLMIEGSRIDMAAHNNDGAAHVREILAYQEAVAAVKAYVDAHPDTVMISVSDHETGGLSVARQVNRNSYPDYLWKPQALVGVARSVEMIAPDIVTFRNKTTSLSDRREWIKTTVVQQWMNIKDATDAEIDSIEKAAEADRGVVFGRLMFALSEMQSMRAQLGWATGGHSAVDVNLYAHGLNAHKLTGNRENTEIGHFIVQQLKLDLDSVTERLRQSTVNGTFAGVDRRGGSVGPAPYEIIHYHH
ncbi:alkaline phosphatase [Phlyctochytrium arcticum]|nr:alkaline phosphatase [Phlyctochytrium arcticum]KAI9102626.1 alkaline phosphatase [Phlyctochytrium arcticum]